MNLNAGEVLKPVFDFLDDSHRGLWSLSVSRAGLVVHDCDRVDIQRRFAAKNPASPAHHRRHRCCDPATGTTTNANHISRTRFRL